MSENIIEQLVSVLNPRKNGAGVHVDLRGRRANLAIDVGDGKVIDLPTGAEPLTVYVKNAEKDGHPNRYERAVRVYSSHAKVKPGTVVSEGVIVASQCNGHISTYALSV